MGILTLADVPLRLRIPNLVVRKLLLDRLLEIFLPDEGDSAQARLLALSVFQEGDLEPLLSFLEKELLPVLSNRDRGAAPKPGQSGSGERFDSAGEIRAAWLSAGHGSGEARQVSRGSLA